MSSLNIIDPKKREQRVNEFIQLKRNIQLNNMSERIGDIEMKRDMSKIFSPIIESQQKAAEITQKAIGEIPKQLALELPTKRQIAIEQPPQNLSSYGKTAVEYLQKIYEDPKIADTKYGIRSTDNKFYIGNKEVNIDGNDIILNENRYTGTPGLWELLTRNNPQNYSEDDKRKYADILYATNAMYVDYDPNKRPSSSTGTKWKNIISDIWKTKPLSIKEIPSVSTDPNELMKRFNLLKSSKEAGHSNVVPEMNDIANKLFQLGVIDEEQYEEYKKQN